MQFYLQVELVLITLDGFFSLLLMVGPLSVKIGNRDR